MNKVLIILSCLLFLSLSLFAQNSFINFSEEEMLINGVSTNVVRSILKGDKQSVDKAWSLYIRKNFNERVKEKDDILYVNEIVIHRISDKRGDLMLYTFTDGADVSFNMAYKLGYDVYINSEKFPKEMTNMMDFAELFVSEYYSDFLPGYIKDSKKNLKKLNREKKRSEKNLKAQRKAARKNEKSISKNNKTIEKESQNISKNLGVEDKVEKSELSLRNLRTENSSLENAILQSKTSQNTSKEVIDNLEAKINALQIKKKSAQITLSQVEAKLKLLK